MSKYALSGMNVLDAALQRIRWIFDEFEHVSVCSSGGKDSTVVAQLALQVAAEKDRLPLRIWFLDQECEFESTERYQRHLMHLPGVDPHWYQIPFYLSNAASHNSEYLHCWGPGEEWVREKEPDAITENDFGTEYFYELMTAIGQRESPNGAVLNGLRAEESPGRRLGLTSAATYKFATWGHNHPPDKLGPQVYTMAPIFDWRYWDVWKAILDHGWAYNPMYDHQHRYGVPTLKMRVSNFHHSTAVHSLYYLQEVEPAMWEKATRRLSGINGVGQLQSEAFQAPKQLPYMFTTWIEYRDFLLDGLVAEKNRARMRKMFANLDYNFWFRSEEERARLAIKVILLNDHYGVAVNNYAVVHRRSTPHTPEEYQALAAQGLFPPTKEKGTAV